MDSKDPTSFFVISPDTTLSFRRPFTTGVIKQSLAVTNTHPYLPIAFKVKTTAPKQYCVRPNSGRVRPGQTVEVRVLLQTMREDPPPDFKCKDKFLVQSIVVSEDVMNLRVDEASNVLQEMWTLAENQKKLNPEHPKMGEKKLRVAYLPAADSNGLSPEPTTVPTLSKKPPSPVEEYHAAPLPRAVTEYHPAPTHRTPSVTTKTDSVYSTAPSAFQPQQQQSQPQLQEKTPRYSTVSASSTPSQPLATPPQQNAYAAPQQPTPAPHQAPASALSVETEREIRDAKEQVRKLQATIEAYRSEVERLTALRNRKIGAEDIKASAAASSGSAALQQQQQQMLPLQVVAILCVIAFLLGATFF